MDLATVHHHGPATVLEYAFVVSAQPFDGIVDNSRLEATLNVPERDLATMARSDAQALMALPDLLSESGLPASVMNHPAIALKNLEQRMKEWTLL